MKFSTIMTLYIRNLKQYRRLPAVLAFSFIVPEYSILFFLIYLIVYLMYPEILTAIIPTTFILLQQ